MKLILHIFAIALFANSTLAQDNVSKAWMLDEFFMRGNNNNEVLVEKTRTFLAKLKNEKDTVRGAIIFYDTGRLEDEGITNRIVADKTNQTLVRRLVAIEPDIDPSRIRFIEGKLTGRPGIQYWLIPEKAEFPTPFDSDWHPPCACFTMAVYGPLETNYPSKGIKFFAWVGNGSKQASFTYNWTVSGGKIVAGQATDEIRVEITAGVKEVTASLELGGLDLSCNCPTMDSHTTKIITLKP